MPRTSSGLPSLAILRYPVPHGGHPPRSRCRSPKPMSPCSRSTIRSRARTCSRATCSRRSSRHLNELDQRKDLAGLVIRSAKPGMFIAGADLKEFVTWLDAPKEEVASYCRRGQQLFGRLCCGQLRHDRGDRRHVRRRRGRARDVVRSPNFHRRRQNRLRLSRGEARPVSRLGRHGPRAANDRPCERGRARDRRREHRCPRRRAHGPGE